MRWKLSHGERDSRRPRRQLPGSLRPRRSRPRCTASRRSRCTNAVKHAQAWRASARWAPRRRSSSGERTTGSVAPAPRRGTGLIGLKDRVDTLGGTISFASPAGAGTTIRVRLPAGGGNPPLRRLDEAASAPASGWPERQLRVSRRDNSRAGRDDNASFFADVVACILLEEAEMLGAAGRPNRVMPLRLGQRSPRLVACSVCLSVRDGRPWIEVGEAIRRLRTFNATT